MVGTDAHERPHNADMSTQVWRLRFIVGNLIHYTEWKADFATVENYYEQYRRDEQASDVAIERRERVRQKEIVTDGGTDARPLTNARHQDQRFQLAGKLRCLADVVEQQGRSLDHDSVDLFAQSGVATVVASFELEAPPEIITDGGQEMVFVSGGDRRRRYHEQETCYYLQQMTDPQLIPKADVAVDGCAYCTNDTVDPEELIEVCPECDSPRFQAVMGSGFDAPKVDHNYRCRASGCNETFDEPATRPRRGNSKTLGGLAGKLLKADQDDVSAEHVEDDEQIVTDGGADTVIVSSSAGRRGNTTYHRDETCGYVQRMRGTVEKPLSVLNGHYNPCSRCASEDVLADGGYPNPGTADARHNALQRRSGGQGLPPAAEPENDSPVWLFTCVRCGARWADPLAPITQCRCGGETVAHQFGADEYMRIRWHDDPRKVGER